MGLKIWKREVCTNCVRALFTRTRLFLNYFRRRPCLRGPSPASYEAAGYDKSSGSEPPISECDLAYWVLELRHTKKPQFDWVPWGVLKFGTFRTHLPLVERMTNRVAGVEDARVRRITKDEALRLESNGITVWRKD